MTESFNNRYSMTFLLCKVDEAEWGWWGAELKWTDGVERKIVDKLPPSYPCIKLALPLKKKKPSEPQIKDLLL